MFIKPPGLDLLNRDTLSIFFNKKVCCVFSLESPRRGVSNEYTQYIIFNVIQKISLNYPKSASIEFFHRDLKNEFETAGVNESSVFEPLKVYCIIIYYNKKGYNLQRTRWKI